MSDIPRELEVQHRVIQSRRLARDLRPSLISADCYSDQRDALEARNEEVHVEALVGMLLGRFSSATASVMVLMSFR